MVKIVSAEQSGRAYRAGVRGGDVLVSINGNEINDVLDYRFYLTEKCVEIECLRDDFRYTVTIKKGEYDDVGLDFETPLMDEKQRCKNGCIFCFIDQNPIGLRDTLYFKDDDSRLSFLHGNYITLTNMTDRDVERIIKMRFSPINISIHTTNPQLRVKMMKNKRAGEVLAYLDRFKRAGLSMCAQIVLCRGVNDEEELMRTMRDLAEYAPQMHSVAVVPAGLTKFRDKLYPLTDFSAQEAADVIDTITSFGLECKARFGTRMFYPADEFYLKAGRDIPEAEFYEEYSQLENGVGMMRSFMDEFSFGEEDITELRDSCGGERTVSVATGVASYPMIASLASRIERVCTNVRVHVYEIKNNFFGESITVSGLLTGRDMYEQLRTRELGETLLIPRNSLRYGEDVFLCGMALEELERNLNVKIRVCENDGCDFIDAVVGR